MPSIDEKVVSLKFDSSRFKSGISETLRVLDSLSQKLKLKGAKDGIQQVDAASRKLSFASMASGIENLSGKFVALSTVGITALSNLTNKAIDSGLRIAQSMTIQPAIDGFREYELKMGSIQTILANTSRHGTGLEEVTANLDSLNEYADKTIYNFGDMTRNIGLFTNAGIKVDDATSMIKGFSNEAAASGTNAQGAAGAAYQLSQALSAGTIRLMDWRSLQNVGMGNKNMQLNLIELAEAMGTVSEAGLSGETIQKDFNGSLENGWLSADVMSNYLKIMAGDMTDTEMASLGLSKEVIAGFKKQQVIGEEAATKVRTFTQLMDTMKEAVGSSWAETFNIILGDFEVATDLFTGINDAIGPLIDKMGDARNKLLQGWSDGGGRTALFAGLVAGFEALQNIITPISEAFRDIFPPVTAKNLIDISEAFRDFMVSLIPGTETMNNIRSIAKGFFAVLDIGRMIVVEAAKVLAKLFGAVIDGSGGFLEGAAGVGEYIVAFRDLIKEGNFIPKIFEAIGGAVSGAIGFISSMVGALSDMAKGLNFGDALEARAKQLGALGGVIKSVILPLGEAVKTVFNILFKGDYDGGAWEEDHPIVDFLFNLRKICTDFFNAANFQSMVDLLNTGLLVGIAVLIKKFIGSLSEVVDSGSGIMESINGVFEGLTDTLGAMQASLKADVLLKIAGALGLLTISVVALSLIDSVKLAGALAALTVMFTQLAGALYVFEAASSTGAILKLPIIAVGLTLLGAAVLLFVAAVKGLSTIPWDQLLVGMTGLVGILGSLVVTVQLMSGFGQGMVTAGAGLLLIAAAVRVLVTAVAQLGGMDWETIARGLTGVAGILVALAIFTRLSEANAAGIGQGIGLILLAQALQMLVGVLGALGALPLEVLAQGLLSMGAALGIVALAMTAMPSNLILTGAGLLVVANALVILTQALIGMSAFSWEEIARSLTTLAGSMLILAVSLTAMSGTLLGSAALMVASAALGVLAPVLIQLSAIPWDGLLVGLVALGSTLGILAIGLMAMAGAIPGTVALLAAATALAVLTPVLVTLSGFSWAGLGMGLISLATAFGVIGAAGLVLAPLTPVLLALGVAIGLLGVAMLAAGAGLSLFAAGLVTISGAGAAAALGLASFVTTVLGLLPQIVTALGQVLVTFAQAISSAAPAVAAAITTVIKSLIDSVISLLPSIETVFNRLIELILSVITTNVPRIVQAGFDMLISFLEIISSNIGKVVDVATDIMVNFLDGLERNIPKVVDKGADVVIAFVNSLADTIERRSGDMREAAGRVGTAMIDGLTGGLAAKAGAVRDKMGEIAGGAVNYAKQVLGIHSPSRVMHGLGEFTSMGFANGLIALASRVKKSAQRVGTSAIDGIKKGVASKKYNSDLNVSPTIRPVVDLSDVRKKAGEVSKAFKASDISVGASFAKAQANNRSLSTDKTNRQEETGTAGKQISFIQNNYSPKHLKASDIYRNTRSQLAMAERM